MNQKLYYIKSRIDPNLPWTYLQPYNPAALGHSWGSKETAAKVDGRGIPKEFQTTDYEIEACPEGEEPVAVNSSEINTAVKKILGIDPGNNRRTATEVRNTLGMKSEEQRFVRREGQAMSARESILRESIELICKEREEDYGSPDDNFATIANLWSAYLEAKAKKLSAEGGHTGPALFYYLNPKDVAVLNILQKVSRLVTSPDKRDHWRDIADYAGLGGGIGG